MRVKIQGQITAERLAAALGAVQARFDEVEEGFRFFGANLYLTAYAADGRPMDLVDHKGDTLMITIGVPSGAHPRAIHRRDERYCSCSLGRDETGGN